MDPAAALLCLLGAVAYGAGRRRLALRGRAWPATRTAAWAAGLVALWVATQPPLADLEATSLTGHAAQHAVLGMAAPLLLALGAPVTLALQATSRPTQRAILRLLHTRVVGLVSHPVVALALFGGSVFALYLTPLLELSLRDGAVHAAVHVHLLAAGSLFFWSVLAVDPPRWRLPHPARILLVLLTVPLHAMLGLAVVSSRELLAGGWYGDRADQELAGAVLWLSGDLLGLVAAALVVAQWVAHDRREAGREDRLVAATAGPAPAARR